MGLNAPAVQISEAKLSSTFLSCLHPPSTQHRGAAGRAVRMTSDFKDVIDDTLTGVRAIIALEGRSKSPSASKSNSRSGSPSAQPPPNPPPAAPSLQRGPSRKFQAAEAYPQRGGTPRNFKDAITDTLTDVRAKTAIEGIRVKSPSVSRSGSPSQQQCQGTTPPSSKSPSPSKPNYRTGSPSPQHVQHAQHAQHAQYQQAHVMPSSFTTLTATCALRRTRAGCAG